MTDEQTCLQCRLPDCDETSLDCELHIEERMDRHVRYLRIESARRVRRAQRIMRQEEAAERG